MSIFNSLKSMTGSSSSLFKSKNGSLANGASGFNQMSATGENQTSGYYVVSRGGLLVQLDPSFNLFRSNIPGLKYIP